jgi:HK97 family phage prohead protease
MTAAPADNAQQQPPATTVQPHAAQSQAVRGTPAPAVISTVAGVHVTTFDVRIDPQGSELRDFWSTASQSLQAGQALNVPEAMAVKRTMFFPLAEAREAEVQQQDTNDGHVKLTAVINTREIDRYMTIIEPRGGDFQNYKRNPVLLWAHGMDENVGTVPIGEVNEIRVHDDYVEVDLTIYGDQEVGARIGQMYKKKQLRGFSIGFIPKSFAVEMIDEQPIVRFSQWELVELSAVSIPANPSALARELEADGQVDQRLASYLGQCLQAATRGQDPLDVVCRSYGMPTIQRAVTNQARATSAAAAPVASSSNVARRPADQGNRGAAPLAPTSAPSQGMVQVPVALASGIDQLLSSVGRSVGIVSGDAAAIQHAIQMVGDLTATRGELCAADLSGITARLAADLQVDWDGQFDPLAAVRGVDEGTLDNMSALILMGDGSRDRRFIHHRSDGTISWPAVAASMGELITGHCNLTADVHRMAYDHLAAHYHALGIECPEYRAHTSDEAYDLALAGTLAFIDWRDGGSAWLFMAPHTTPDQRTVPMFREIATGRTAEMTVPGVGRLNNPALWGQRALPDQRGMEQVLQQLAQSQQRLEASQLRDGQPMTPAAREALNQIAAGLSTATDALRSSADGLTQTITSLRELLGTEGTAGTEAEARTVGTFPTVIAAEASAAPVVDRAQTGDGANPMDLATAANEQFSRQMVAATAPAIDQAVTNVRSGQGTDWNGLLYQPQQPASQ